MYANAKRRQTSVPKGQITNLYSSFRENGHRQVPTQHDQLTVSLTKSPHFVYETYNTPVKYYRVFDTLINLIDNTSDKHGYRYVLSICEHISQMDGRKFNFIIHPHAENELQRITVQAFRMNNSYRVDKQFVVDADQYRTGHYIVFMSPPSLRATYVPLKKGEVLTENLPLGLNYDASGDQYIAGARESRLLEQAPQGIADTLGFLQQSKACHFYNLDTLYAALRNNILLGKCCYAPKSERCHCQHLLPVFEFEVDDFGEDLKPHPKKNKSRFALTNKVNVKDTFGMDNTPMSIQALDNVNVETGAERITSTITTPDGPRKVIHLSNKGIMPNKKISYLPSTFLPTAAYVWNAARTTELRMSHRVKHYMMGYERYNCQYVYRIVAKPSLFNSVRVWVSLKDQNSVGFEWNPSEENEIYVLVPWQKLEIMESTTDTSVPSINITNLSSTVYSTGTATSIIYTIFVAPFNMFLYTPKIIPEPKYDHQVPSKWATLTDIDWDSAGGSAIAARMFRKTINVNSGQGFLFIQHHVEGRARFDVINPAIPETKFTIFRTDGGALVVDSFSLTRGSYTLEYHTDEVYPYGMVLWIAHNDIFSASFSSLPELSPIEDTVTSATAIKRQHHSVSGLTFIGVDETDVWVKSDSPFILCYRKPNTNLSVPGDKMNYSLYPQDVELMRWERVGEWALRNKPFFLPAGTYRIVINASSGIAVNFTTFSINATIVFSPTELSTTSHIIKRTATSETFEHQIMELDYDPSFNDNHQIIGIPGPHTTHCDTHWEFVRKFDFTTNADSYVAGPPIITASIKATRRCHKDIAKYNQYSKYPVFQFSAASIPTTNCLLRITQFRLTDIPETLEFNSFLQLPGVEWDPKTGPLYLQPYWNNMYPSEFVEPIANYGFAMHVVTGTIGDALSVVMKINYSSVEYHNFLIGSLIYARNEVTPVGFEHQIDDGEEQVPTTTITNDLTIGAASAVSSDPVEVEIASKDVKALDSLPKEKVTGLAGRFEFVHSDIIKSTTAVYYYAINHNMFGRDAYEEYQGYEFWTGKPIFKLSFSCGTATAADVHIVQIPPNIDVEKFDYEIWSEIVRARPAGAVSVRDGSYEVEMEWMAPSTRTSRNEFAGYLAVVMPFSNQQEATQYNPSDIIVSLHTDCSNVSFLVDRYDDTAPNTLPPLTDTLERPAAMTSKLAVQAPPPSADIAALTANVNSLMQMMQTILASKDS